MLDKTLGNFIAIIFMLHTPLKEIRLKLASNTLYMWLKYYFLPQKIYHPQYTSPAPIANNHAHKGINTDNTIPSPTHPTTIP